MEISDQQRLLQYLRDHEGSISSGAMFDLERIIMNEREVLDPEWREVWEKVKSAAQHFFPPTHIRSMEARISQLKTIPEKLEHVTVDPKTRVTFLLGAGASAPSKIPTVRGLLEELWRRAAKLTRDDLDRLADFCKARSITNIEDLLTAAYTSNDSAKNANVVALLDYFLFEGAKSTDQENEAPLRRAARITRNLPNYSVNVSSISLLQSTLETLFSLLTSTMIAASPNQAHARIAQFIKAHVNASIVTTNYDACMDEALIGAEVSVSPCIGARDIRSRAGTKLIKMHGSINWAYCDSCQSATEYALLDLKRAYVDDSLSYPVTGICKNCGGIRRPLLVPPLSNKFIMFPDLIEIWNSARDVIDNSDLIVAVGYSFAEADSYMTKMIMQAMSNKRSQQMIVLDITSNVARSLKKRLTATIDNFDSARFVSIVGDCEQTLPEVLDAISKLKPPKESRPTPTEADQKHSRPARRNGAAVAKSTG